MPNLLFRFYNGWMFGIAIPKSAKRMLFYLSDIRRPINQANPENKHRPKPGPINYTH